MKSTSLLGLTRSRGLKRAATKPEKVMIEALEAGQYWYKFQSYFYQDKVLFIPDFRLATAKKKLILEIDGASHRSREEYDRRRTAWLESNRNCIVVRVTNEQVMDDAQSVLRILDQYEPLRTFEKRCPVSMKQLYAQLHKERECAEFIDPADQFKFYCRDHY